MDFFGFTDFIFISSRVFKIWFDSELDENVVSHCIDKTNFSPKVRDTLSLSQNQCQTKMH